MIEVQNVRAINKGFLVASCDVHVVPWHIVLREVKLFQKGNSRWISMPSKESINSEGQKRYYELIAFDSEEVKDKFRNSVMEALDKQLNNPAPVAPKPKDEVPF